MKSMKVLTLGLVMVVLFFSASGFAADVSVLIVANDGTSDIDIEDWTNQDSHWFFIRVENTTLSPVTLNSVQVALSYEWERLSIVEVEKDNTDFANSTFSSNISNPTVDGEHEVIKIIAADATGISLAATTGKATVAWLRLDPSRIHVDTKYDIKVGADIYDGSAKKTYKRNDTAQVYCDTLKGDNSFGGPTNPVTAYDVLLVAQQAAGVVDHIGDSQLLWDVMDMDADGVIDAEDVYHTLKEATDPAYVPPADETTHHPAPPANPAFAVFNRQKLGDSAAQSVFRLLPLEYVAEGHYRVRLETEGLPSKPVGVDIDFAKAPDVRVDIKPGEFLAEAQRDWAAKTTTARLVFAGLEPFGEAGLVAEIELWTADAGLPEFSIQNVWINEGRPVKEGEEENIVRWETQKILTPPTKVLQNYPNPFNPETWIPYQLAEPAEVSITVYNVSGQMVRRLDLGTQMPGFYLTKPRAAHWDGRNDSAEAVASGVYFYSIQAGKAATTRKMLLIK